MRLLKTLLDWLTTCPTCHHPDTHTAPCSCGCHR
jgi:hypothetical protein